MSNFDYKANLKARRGHNYTYLTDKIWRDLKAKGYNEVLETISELTAKEMVSDYRSRRYFARIFCRSNRLRIRIYVVYVKYRKPKS